MDLVSALLQSIIRELPLHSLSHHETFGVVLAVLALHLGQRTKLARRTGVALIVFALFTALIGGMYVLDPQS